MKTFKFTIDFQGSEIYDGEMEAKDLNEADKKLRNWIDFDIHEIDEDGEIID